jgi:saccharopine dehydrogenase-like NADP-dependent oxidoreductase
MTSYGKIVSAAVETGLDWLIHTFGNESAAREVKEKWREKGGLVMPTSGVACD